MKRLLIFPVMLMGIFWPLMVMLPALSFTEEVHVANVTVYASGEDLLVNMTVTSGSADIRVDYVPYGRTDTGADVTAYKELADVPAGDISVNIGRLGNISGKLSVLAISDQREQYVFLEYKAI